MARKSRNRVTYYQVYHFPGGKAGVDEEYLIHHDPESPLADDPPPSFMRQRDAEEFMERMFEQFPSETLRVVKITQEILPE